MRKGVLLTLNELGRVPSECWGESDMSNNSIEQGIKELCSEVTEVSSLDPCPLYFRRLIFRSKPGMKKQITRR